MICSGGHIGFSIKTKNINFVKYYTRNISAKLVFKGLNHFKEDEDSDKG